MGMAAYEDAAGFCGKESTVAAGRKDRASSVPGPIACAAPNRAYLPIKNKPRTIWMIRD
jgi:hypothetical protein